jgi:hypothetical protein
VLPDVSGEGAAFIFKRTSTGAGENNVTTDTLKKKKVKFSLCLTN